MSRSGYIEYDGDNHLALGRWRGAVASSIRGKRGQKLLRDLRDALDDMPDKRLAADSFLSADGDFCTLGVLGNRRGIDMSDLEPDEDGDCDADKIGQVFDIASPLAQEIMWMNDEYFCREESPERRWVRMRAWVDKNIATPTTGDIER